MKMYILILSLFSVAANSACNVLEDGACTVYGQEAIDGVHSIIDRSGTLYGQEAANFRKNLVRINTKTIQISIYDCEDNIVERVSTPSPPYKNDISSISGPRMKLTLKVIDITENDNLLEINFSHYPKKHAFYKKLSNVSIDTRILLSKNKETELASSCGDRITYDLKGNVIQSSLNKGYRYTVELIQ